MTSVENRLPSRSPALAFTTGVRRGRTGVLFRLQVVNYFELCEVAAGAL
jgi:hypothetical protein